MRPAYVLSVLVYVRRGDEVLVMETGVFQAKFVYVEALKLVTWTEYPG